MEWREQVDGRARLRCPNEELTVSNSIVGKGPFVMQKEPDTSYGESSTVRGCADRTALEAIFPRVCFPHRRQSSRRVSQRPLFFRHFRRTPENHTVSTLEQLQEIQPCMSEYCESNLEEEGVVAMYRGTREFGTSSQLPLTGRIPPPPPASSSVGENSPIEGSFAFVCFPTFSHPVARCGLCSKEKDGFRELRPFLLRPKVQSSLFGAHVARPLFTSPQAT